MLCFQGSFAHLVYGVQAAGPKKAKGAARPRSAKIGALSSLHLCRSLGSLNCMKQSAFFDSSPQNEFQGYALPFGEGVPGSI